MKSKKVRFVRWRKNSVFLLSAWLLIAAAMPLHAQEKGRVVAEYVNRVNASDTAYCPKPGIIIAGDSSRARTFQTFSSKPDFGIAYAEMANRYKRILGDGVRVYCTAIPTAVEFYCPDMARPWTQSERTVINRIFAHLSDSVEAVDMYTPLAAHVEENIYARTDHHWLPLGAYYAAEAFARVAGVPFHGLKNYKTQVLRNFVGSMNRYSGRVEVVKNHPEDFIYYVPQNILYQTDYVEYALTRDRKGITGETTAKGPFFKHYHDGSVMAYCTFMGGDNRLTHVSTATRNGRRLLILKDSFGNALPSYLFYGFEDIHVVDCRYFTQNIVDYVRRHAVTDVLFCNNVGHACLTVTTDAYEKYLTQAKKTDNE